MATVKSPATLCDAPNGDTHIITNGSSSSSADKPRKLHGRAFYKSLGSPRMILAPMVDQSEFAWRLLTRSYMPQSTSTDSLLLAYTPMLHARLFSTTPKYRDSAFQPLRTPVCTPPPPVSPPPPQTSLHLDGHPSTDRPLFVQFCANAPQDLLSAARYVQPFCDAVDLNLGCPQGIAKKGHYGAFLQEDQDLVYDMINTLHRELDVPVTAKIRVLDTREETLAYAQRVLDAGASILTVHGRRREQKGHKTGLADWSVIRYLREALPRETVLFANGNILHYEDIARCLEATGADGVMSAEGNLCDPTIFAAPPRPGQEGREYWRSSDGTGGYRMDAVMRRYMDIIYTHVLEVPPPDRTPLFVPSDPLRSHPSSVPAVAHGPPTTSSCKPTASSPLAHDADRTTTPPPPSKRQKLDHSPLSSSMAPSIPSTPSATAKPSLTKAQLKKQQKKALKSHQRSLPKTTDPSLLAMQAHLFHLLRPLITRFTHIRDALARCRAGDMAAYEGVLRLVEGVTREGMLGLLPRETEADEVEGEGSSREAARKCRREVWICQARVRLSPEEAVVKGGLTLSRKEKEKERREGTVEAEVEVERVEVGRGSEEGAREEAEAREVVEVPREGVVCG